ncbi:MAG: hypothetical protein ACOYON_10790 [Fimbriimonas sp.]
MAMGILWKGSALVAGRLLVYGLILLGQQGPGVPQHSDDEEVIEAMLLDFLRDPAKEANILGRGMELVLMLPKSPGKMGMLYQDQFESEFGKKGPPPALVRALYERNKGRKDPDAKVTDFSKMRLDKRIVLGEFSLGFRNKTDANAKLESRAKGVFQCYAPGYSEDKKTALVRAWVGPSSHGAMATYVLERSANGWVIKWRQFSFFV